jgi:uncharacterized protein YaeQ
MYVFTVRIADADRNVYESLTLRVAQHPSEAAEYLVTRVLAYCLEYAEGITFSKGLSDPEEPTIGVRDLTGVLQSWIDIGAPGAPRLHKAGKAARRVAVYAHREVTPWLERLSGERIYRADALEIYVMDRDLVAALVARLERRMDLDLSVSENTLYVSMGQGRSRGRWSYGVSIHKDMVRAAARCHRRWWQLPIPRFFAALSREIK